jgi:hypothetical protein
MLLNDIPIIPTIGGRTREIYQDGLSQGRNPYVFAKVGDSNSVRTEFLGLISYGLYDLGSYGYLQETIDYYRVPIGPGLTDPFLRQSYAAQPGYTAWFASDPRWHHPACPDLTPVECEYSHINPSVALILFGMADIRYLTYPDYEQAMRRIIEISIRRGIVPVLYTFPVREDARPGEWETSLRFNNVLVNLAREYQVPLVNLWRAVYPLPDHGVDADQTHLSIVDGTFNRFTGDENRGGYTMWNLVTLQTLDAIRCSVN